MHRNAGSIFILDKTKIGKIDFKKVVVNKSKPNKIDDKVSELFIHYIVITVILRYLVDYKTFKKDHEARRVKQYKFYYNMSVENNYNIIKH